MQQNEINALRGCEGICNSSFRLRQFHAKSCGAKFEILLGKGEKIELNSQLNPIFELPFAVIVIRLIGKLL